ncbi:hypothetical protein F4801DRAFT_350762 [Xylaria longipes]|nr:hypothetical protein F4801DRAFT_350762 [Xylaria longipes]
MPAWYFLVGTCCRALFLLWSILPAGRMMLFPEMTNVAAGEELRIYTYVWGNIMAMRTAQLSLRFHSQFVREKKDIQLLDAYITWSRITIVGGQCVHTEDECPPKSADCWIPSRGSL